MGYGFPILLAYAFLASFLLGLLKTRRWIVVFISIVVVWCVRIGQTEIDLLTAGTTQAYAWLAFLSAAVWFPTFVVAMVGSDLGTRLRRALFAEDAETEEGPDSHPVESEEAAEQ